jgi:hypothetical protein
MPAYGATCLEWIRCFQAFPQRRQPPPLQSLDGGGYPQLPDRPPQRPALQHREVEHNGLRLREPRPQGPQRRTVEGKFGQGKRRYGSGLIREKLALTQGSTIALNILVMNLEKLLELLFVLFTCWFIFSVPEDR